MDSDNRREKDTSNVRSQFNNEKNQVFQKDDTALAVTLAGIMKELADIKSWQKDQDHQRGSSSQSNWRTPGSDREREEDWPNKSQSQNQSQRNQRDQRN